MCRSQAEQQEPAPDATAEEAGTEQPAAAEEAETPEAEQAEGEEVSQHHFECTKAASGLTQLDNIEVPEDTPSEEL